MKSGGVFVVKPAKNIGEEVFTSLLALKLGIYVPKLRVLHADGNEGIQLWNLIINTDKLGASIFGLSGAPYYIIKEYVPAKNMDKFIYTEMKQIFGDETSLSQNAKKRIDELAIVLALDVLTNYGDRLPFIWPNQGNSGNLMISPTGQFLCIENGFNELRSPDQLKNYKKSIKLIFKKLTANPQVEIPEFQHITQRIYSYTDYSFQTLELQKSFRELLKKSVKVDIYEEIKKWKEMLGSFTSKLNGLDGIDLEFINDIWGLFKKYGKLCEN